MDERARVSVSGTTTHAGADSKATTVHSRLLGGSLTLLIGSSLVGITNLAYNVATARLLGPTGFAHAAAVYTILMLMSCLTLSFQVVSAKYVARTSIASERSFVFHSLHRRAWLTGIGIALLLFFAKGWLSHYLNLPDPVLISLLALGTAFYVPLGVRRGYIQGVHAFRSLAINFMLEGFVRLGGALLLIHLGMGVRGAVLASVAAVIVCYFVAIPSPGLISIGQRGVAISFREGLQAIVFFSGQTIINNFDIILVKHFFPPVEAGFYAAIALVGRLVNMCAWSVVNTMFPVSAAATTTEDRDGRPVLFTSLGLVFAILCLLILGLWAIPSFLWKTLFGAQFGMGTYGELAPLLILYAITTGIYSLSSVIITYEMSRKLANTSWVQLAFSGALALGVYMLHQNLRQVILVQLVLMTALLVVLALPLVRPSGRGQTFRAYHRLLLRRVLTQEEVMAEFLKSEFHHAEFDEYRTQFNHLVQSPDLRNAKENSVRQALLFLRRGAMWRELPGDTRWYEVELTTDDLERIRFFPRANWRRMANGSFQLIDVVERIRHRLETSAEGEFFDKLRLLSRSVTDDLVNPTVLLIGANRRAPLTILDGNHRMAAAMLRQPGLFRGRFRFICGLSPQMTRCCWYQTNMNTLLRYFKNLVRHGIYDPDPDIERFEESGS